MTAIPGGPSDAPKHHPVLGSRETEDAAVFAAVDNRIVRRFVRFLLPHKATLAAAAIAMLVFVVTNISIPTAIGYTIGSAIGAAGSPALNVAIAVFALLMAVNVVCGFFQDALTSRLAQAVTSDLRRAMFAHLQDTSLAALDQTHVGRVMSRLQGDVSTIQEFLDNSTSALSDMLTLAGVILVLLEMNLRLGLLTLTVLPALIVLRVFWLPFAKATFRRAREASSIVNSALAENINGIRTVQGSQREAINFGLFEEKVLQNYKAQIGAMCTAAIMTPAASVLISIAMAMVVVVGGSEVLHSTLGVGELVVYILYVQKFFEPVGTLSQQYTNMQRAMAAAYRIFEVLDLPVTVKEKPTAIELKDIEPSLDFQHVTFGYRPGQPILHDVTLQVKPRQLVALVGPTGAGKTSIAALAHRFYDAWEGRICVGGYDVRDVSLDSLGRNVAMVLQEPYLFSGTVIENILYSAPDASQEDAIAAAKLVSAHEFIMKMPAGYDSILGQRGCNLSIGQRQLLSFARALVRDPKIVILDEATASVDSFTEIAIQQALQVLFKDRSVLVIAHRLATVRHADHIIVMMQGRVVEEGTHDDLLARAGLYAHLCSSNTPSFTKPVDAAEDSFVTHT
jgi:ATP-binding cassette, subfamily B, multidrug efflux pump